MIMAVSEPEPASPSASDSDGLMALLEAELNVATSSPSGSSAGIAGYGLARMMLPPVLDAASHFFVAPTAHVEQDILLTMLQG